MYGAHRDIGKIKDLSILSHTLSSNIHNSLSGATNKNHGIETDTPKTGPYFDLTVSKNVTALLGKTAYLTCRVKNLGNRTVSITLKNQIQNHCQLILSS